MRRLVQNENIQHFIRKMLNVFVFRGGFSSVTARVRSSIVWHTRERRAGSGGGFRAEGLEDYRPGTLVVARHRSDGGYDLLVGYVLGRACKTCIPPVHEDGPVLFGITA